MHCKSRHDKPGKRCVDVRVDVRSQQRYSIESDLYFLIIYTIVKVEIHFVVDRVPTGLWSGAIQTLTKPPLTN